MAEDEFCCVCKSVAGQKQLLLFDGDNLNYSSFDLVLNELCCDENSPDFVCVTCANKLRRIEALKTKMLALQDEVDDLMKSLKLIVSQARDRVHSEGDPEKSRTDVEMPIKQEPLDDVPPAEYKNGVKHWERIKDEITDQCNSDGHAETVESETQLFKLECDFDGYSDINGSTDTHNASPALPDCGEESNAASVYDHLLNHRIVKIELTDCMKNPKNSENSLTFCMKSNISSRIRIPRLNKCWICGKSLRNRRNLFRHMKIHTSAKRQAKSKNQPIYKSNQSSITNRKKPLVGKDNVVEKSSGGIVHSHSNTLNTEKLLRAEDSSEHCENVVLSETNPLNVKKPTCVNENSFVCGTRASPETRVSTRRKSQVLSKISLDDDLSLRKSPVLSKISSDNNLSLSALQKQNTTTFKFHNFRDTTKQSKTVLVSQKPISPTWKCTTCGLAFSEGWQLMEHGKIHVQQKTVELVNYQRRGRSTSRRSPGIVGVSLRPSTESHRTLGVIQRHSTKSQKKLTLNNERHYECSMCGVLFSEGEQLLEHGKTHSNCFASNLAVPAEEMNTSLAQTNIEAQYTEEKAGEKALTDSGSGMLGTGDGTTANLTLQENTSNIQVKEEEENLSTLWLREACSSGRKMKSQIDNNSSDRGCISSDAKSQSVRTMKETISNRNVPACRTSTETAFPVTSYQNTIPQNYPVVSDSVAQPVTLDSQPTEFHQLCHRCPACFKVFKNKMTMVKHVRHKHPSHYQPATLDSQLTAELQLYHRCTICYIVFNTKFTLDKHVRDKHQSHRSRHRYACTMCGMVFAEGGQLMDHGKMHM